MKKLILIFIFVANILYSQDNYELKLYDKILPIIFNKNYIRVYVDDYTRDILKTSLIFEIVNNCNEADLLIGKNKNIFPRWCENKPLFATSYKGFKNSNNSFGAFYWRKGRPQIKFKLNTIEKFNLNLPDSLWKYADE